jgi:hypothetical protein
MLRIPHCLYNRLRDGGKVVSLTCRSRSTPLKHLLVLISVKGWVNPRATMWMGILGKLKNFNDLIGFRTYDLISYRYYQGICLEGLTKLQSTSVRIANVATEIRTKDLPSKTPECNCYSSLLGMYRRFGDALTLLYDCKARLHGICCVITLRCLWACALHVVRTK